MVTTSSQLHYHCATCGKRIDPGIQNVIVPLLVCTDHPSCYANVPRRYRTWRSDRFVPDPGRALPCADENCEVKFPPYDETLLRRVRLLPTVHPARQPAQGSLFDIF